MKRPNYETPFKPHTVELIHRLSVHIFTEKESESLYPGSCNGHERDDLIRDDISDWGLEGVEIGVLQGLQSKVLLEWFPGMTLHMVDPWGAFDPEGRFSESGDGLAKKDQIYWDETFATAKAATDFAFDRRVMHRTTSAKAAKTFADKSLDFVFIDGDHSEKGVIEDIEVWSSKLKTNAVIGGHDLDDPRFPGVRLALEQSFPSFYEGIGKTWWAKNPWELAPWA